MTKGSEVPRWALGIVMRRNDMPARMPLPAGAEFLIVLVENSAEARCITIAVRTLDRARELLDEFSPEENIVGSGIDPQKALTPLLYQRERARLRTPKEHPSAPVAWS